MTHTLCKVHGESYIVYCNFFVAFFIAQSTKHNSSRLTVVRQNLVR